MIYERYIPRAVFKRVLSDSYPIPLRTIWLSDINLLHAGASIKVENT